MPGIYAPRTITELRRFARARMTRLALVVAILIPLLYGALYLWAFWNPTGHLDRVPVAIVNVDTGATTGDGTEITAGDQVTEKLLESNALEWHQVSPTEAARGLDNGTYYATLTIPADFSEAVASLGTDHPVQAPLQVRYDDANGYTARTIVSSVMREIRASVSASIGDEAVNKLLVGVSDIRDGLVDASKGAHQLADGTQSAVDGSARLESGAADLAQGNADLAAGAHKAHTGASDLDKGAAKLDTGASDLSAGATRLSTGVSRLDKGAAKLDSGATKLNKGAQDLSSGLSTMEEQTRTLTSSTQKLAKGSQQVADGNKKIADTVSVATDRADEAAAELKKLIAQLPDDDPTKPQLEAALERLQGRIDTVDKQTTTLAQGAQQVADGNAQLAASSTKLRSGIVAADKGASQLSTGASSLATGASDLHTGTTQLKNGASDLATGAGTLADGASQLHRGTTTLANGLATLDTGAQKAAAGADKLHDGLSDLHDGLVTLDNGADKLAKGLSDALAQVPDWNKAERDANSEAMANPVGLDTAFTHEAAENGEGLAPYFIGLSLYVGALILWMLLRPVSRRALAAPVKALRVVLSGLLPAVILGALQVALLMTVLTQFLGLHLNHPLAAVGFTFLISLAFVSLQQMINVVFGPAVGRVVVLIILMLQLTSAGGTYPAITSAGFFQVLHRVLPMTQVVNGLRESITGDLNPTFFTAVTYLGVLVVVSIAIATWAAGRQRTWTMKRLHPEVEL